MLLSARNPGCQSLAPQLLVQSLRRFQREGDTGLSLGRPKGRAAEEPPSQRSKVEVLQAGGSQSVLRCPRRQLTKGGSCRVGRPFVKGFDRTGWGS